MTNKSKNPDGKKILYAGDTTLDSAAAYLAGILTHYELEFDYLASDQPIASVGNLTNYDLYIISDYPVNNWRKDDFADVIKSVENGAGLVMLGGWESYHGLEGEYHDSPLSDLLPVSMQLTDDRVQSATPYVIQPVGKHPITDGLPFSHPPIVGGFNRITPKPTAAMVMQMFPVDIFAGEDGKFSFTTGESLPLLVTGRFGEGKTAALATDVAPHWVGTFVDWGLPRITACADGASQVEIGAYYAEFFARLVKWSLRDE
jgi:uncharacterized membrane protein